MKLHKIATIFFILWGVVHVLGGAVMLASAWSGNTAETLKMFATADEALAGTEANPVMDAVIAFHAFNILWFGAAAVVIAVLYNWKNDRQGFWLNALLIGLADLGLILTLVGPGYMSFADGSPGIVLGGLAIVLAAIALRAGNQTQREVPA